MGPLRLSACSFYPPRPLFSRTLPSLLRQCKSTLKRFQDVKRSYTYPRHATSFPSSSIFQERAMTAKTTQSHSNKWRLFPYAYDYFLCNLTYLSQRVLTRAPARCSGDCSEPCGGKVCWWKLQFPYNFHPCFCFAGLFFLVLRLFQCRHIPQRSQLRRRYRSPLHSLFYVRAIGRVLAVLLQNRIQLDDHTNKSKKGLQNWFSLSTLQSLGGTRLSVHKTDECVKTERGSRLLKAKAAEKTLSAPVVLPHCKADGAGDVSLPACASAC